MAVVLRGFPSAEYVNVRLNENPCAALLIEKNLTFLNWKLIPLEKNCLRHQRLFIYIRIFNLS
jgi:hypothetical protein